MLETLTRIKKRFVRSYYRKVVSGEVPGNSHEEPCLICGTIETETLWEHDRFSLPVKTCKCVACGFIYVNPRPSKEYLNKFYSSKRYRALYLGELKAKDLSFDFAEAKLKENLAFFDDSEVRELIKTEYSKSSVLDYGSAVGQFLVGFRDHFAGAKVYGVEPGAHINQVSRNDLDGVYPDIASIPEDIKFDLITSWHVVEHVWNPIDTLRQLKSRLNEGGRLVIEVPDVERYTGIRNIHIGHIFHFDKDSITKLLEKSGFEVLLVTHNHVQDKPYGMKVIAR